MIRLGIMALTRTLKFIEMLLRSWAPTRAFIRQPRAVRAHILRPRMTRARVLGVSRG